MGTWYFIFIDENASHSSRALLMSGGKSGSGFTGEEMIQDQGKDLCATSCLIIQFLTTIIVKTKTISLSSEK